MNSSQEGLFFDDYYRRVRGNAGPIERMSAAYHLTLVANAYLGNDVRITSRLEDTRVYQLQWDAMECWFGTVGRLARRGYLPPFPQFPYPIWIEPPNDNAMALFDADPIALPEKASLIGNDAVRAIWGDYDLQHAGAFRFIFFMISGRYKALVVAPDGTWQLEQDEHCMVASCPIAAEHQNNSRRAPLSSTQFVRGDICPCHFFGDIWYRQLVVLGYLLSAEGAIHQQVVKISRGGKRSRREKEDEQWNKAHVNYVTISLHARDHVRYMTSQKDGEEVSATAEAATVMDGTTQRAKRPVGAHFRLLIPGEGLPWKHAKLILIKNFMRTPRGPLQTRYRVIT